MSLTLASNSEFFRFENNKNDPADIFMMNNIDTKVLNTYLLVLRSYICPICKEVSGRRMIICYNGHTLCAACLEKNNRTLIMTTCIMCRQPLLVLPIPLLGEQDVVSHIQSAIQEIITFTVGDHLDVMIKNYEQDIWIEGEVIMVDYESMEFLVRIGRFILNRPFFSRRLAKLHTHTTPWRNLNILSIGKYIEYRLETSMWVPAVVVFHDCDFNYIYIAYQTSETEPIRLESVCVKTSDRIAIYPTFLNPDNHWNWKRLTLPFS